MVLAYRLNRDIQPQTLMCQGDYYYLTVESFGNSCSPKIPTTVSASRKLNLQLLHLSAVAN